MCGIVAVLARPAGRAAPSADEVLRALDAAVAVPLSSVDPAAIAAAAAHVGAVDQLLRGVPGVRALVDHPDLEAAIVARLDLLESAADDVERRVEDGQLATSDVEAGNAALISLRDALWAIRRDRLRTARAVSDLAGRDAPDAALAAFTAVQTALSAIDRLEVRGRDSAGLHVYVWDHGLDLGGEAVQRLLATRASDPLFPSGSVRESGGVLSFVYKAAAEIGELGDNTRVIRDAIRTDGLIHLAVAARGASASVLAHTRWASVGIISEPNAHPLNHEEEDGPGGQPYVVAALNGDVDNHADLKAMHDLRIPAPITTDAKVIPALVSRDLAAGHELTDAFRRTVGSFEGSVAIAAAAAAHPGRVLLAQRGSGQALYVGLAEDLFIVASEPYGVVEETGTYLRMDGESEARPGEAATRGQVLVLDGARAGLLDGIERYAYDGTPLALSEAELVTAEVTTRDIDRGSSPHFLLKEISEAPSSLRKTLRGRIRETDDGLSVELGDAAIPPALVERLRSGAIRRVLAIGQGTAAVAGQSVAEVLSGLVGRRLVVESSTATEFSGFGMSPDLSDTLVVAVSQSGTTTDTNRTVDLARGRGAAVIAIVNRRNSDLTDKADGVLYTSDGRDVEMSVASTKAFYAQVAAGVLLACAIAEHVGINGDERRQQLLAGLRELPDAMRTVLGQRPAIAEAARRFSTHRRSWAVVGNGPNRVAAEEVRIKLSELCYKSIACDVTEDKKHIDLSSEPMVLVCAAGLSGSTADDVSKEVAIYRAHKAAPIVIASEGEERFTAALEVITVPVVEPRLAFVLSTMVGHLFGYEAALAIDGLALPLREGREAIEAAASGTAGGEEMLSELRDALVPVQHRFADGLRSGAYDGVLEASTAVRLSSLLRAATSPSPLEAYQLEQGKVGTPAVLVDDVSAALTRAIEELTRPVDAIKHQAKTVTVGITRSDEGLLAGRFVQEVLATGVGRDRIAYRSLKHLAALNPAVAAVTGFIRYRIEGDPHAGAVIEIVDRGGLGRDLPSRVERNHELRGTKRRVALDQEVLVARGRADGRTVVFVPELKGAQVTGITLLHVRIPDRLPAATIKSVLQGYRGRYDALADFITETEPTFRDDLLAAIDVIDLLTAPIADLADLWRS